MEQQGSIVTELQQMAINNNHDITELLRKALLVAAKLGRQDFKEWINCELNGYQNIAVPPYRICRAELIAEAPDGQTVPLLIPQRELADKLCKVEIREPIVGLINLLKQSKPGSNRIIIPLPNEQLIPFITQQLNGPYAMCVPHRIIGQDQLAFIVDAVRSTILQWALKLEGEGILGAGLSFSKTEKQKAASSTIISIRNFQGILGDVAHSNVKQYLNMTVKKGDFQSLSEYLKKSGLEDTDISELKKILQSNQISAESRTFPKSVSTWIGKMVAKAANGAWQIGVGTSADLLSKAIAVYLGLPS